MRNLIRAEVFKLTKESNYKLLLTFSFVIGLILGIIALHLGTAATGADWYGMIGTGILYNAVLISIFTADYIGNEFANRTFSSSISYGILRGNIFGAKCTIFFIALLPVILLHDLVPVFALTIKNGFGMQWGLPTIALLMNRTLYCILCNFTMSSFILFIAVLVKNKIQIIGFGIVGIYLLFQMVINTRNPLLLKILQVTFIYQLDSMDGMIRPMHVQVPFWIVVLSSLVGTGIFLLVALFVFQKSDLK